MIRRERDWPDPPKATREPSLHDELVARAVRWLRGTQRCCLVLAEKVSLTGETPDAIGYRAGGRSFLVECKTSRADYQADQRKVWRRAGTSMGEYRYYMTPRGLLDPAELPETWGLLEVLPTIVRVVKVAKVSGLSVSAGRAERLMLISEARPDTPYQAARPPEVK